MRRSCLSVIFLLGLSAPAAAQQCETMVVKDAAGAVVSNSVMCVGADGVWTPQAPAPVSVAPRKIEPPARLQAPARIQPPAIVSGPTPVQGPKPVDLAPQIVTPTPVHRPVIAVPEQVIVPIESVIVEPPAPVSTPTPVYVEPPLAVTTPIITPTPTPSAPAPTGRQDVYAKLGLVCVAKQAVLCTPGSCSGLCAGKEGWCDGKSGEVYASREAIERVYCRKKRK